MQEDLGILDVIRPLLTCPDDEMDAFNVIMGYYFRVWKWSVVRDTLASLCDNRAKGIKKDIPVGYRFLCLKMAITDMRVNLTEPEDAAKRNQVHADDQHTLHYARALSFFQEIPEDLPYLPPTEVRQIAFQVVTTTRRMAHDFIHCRMRFLYNYDGISYEDILSLFRIRAITLVYSFFPSLSGDHLTNIIRKDIKNYGLNLLEMWVRERRGICKPSNDDRTVQYCPKTSLHLAEAAIDSNPSPAASTEISMVIEHFCENGSEEHKELMQFLSFSSPDREKDFVKKYGVEGERTCKEVCDRIGMKPFRTAVLNFLGLSRDTLHALHESLRTELLMA